MIKKGINAAAAILLALGASGCAEEEVPETAEVAETPPAAETPVEAAAPAGTVVGVADIVGDPTTYNGTTVTVEADVEEVLGGQAFKLDEDSALEGGIDDDLLVLYPRSANLADIDDQWLDNRVRVTGTVRAVSVVEVEREIGWDLDAAIEAELEGMRPVLIAQSVERVGSGE